MNLTEFVFLGSGGKSLPFRIWRKSTVWEGTLRMPDDTNIVFVRAMGGGGGGGGSTSSTSGGGGASGLLVEMVAPVTPGHLVPASVGDGGDGGRGSYINNSYDYSNSGANGQAGKKSSFGDVVAMGGGGGGGGKNGTGNHGDGARPLEGYIVLSSGGGAGTSTGGGLRGVNPAGLFVDGVFSGSGGLGGYGSFGGNNGRAGMKGAPGFLEIIYWSAGEIIEA